MKKVFFALAVVAMFSFAACNGSTTTEDTNAVENTMVDENANDQTIDEMANEAETIAEDAEATLEATEVAE